jgi:hypothetical protein
MAAVCDMLPPLPVLRFRQRMRDAPALAPVPQNRRGFFSFCTGATCAAAAGPIVSESKDFPEARTLQLKMATKNSPQAGYALGASSRHRCLGFFGPGRTGMGGGLRAVPVGAYMGSTHEKHTSSIGPCGGSAGSPRA